MRNCSSHIGSLLCFGFVRHLVVFLASGKQKLQKKKKRIKTKQYIKLFEITSLSNSGSVLNNASLKVNKLFQGIRVRTIGSNCYHRNFHLNSSFSSESDPLLSKILFVAKISCYRKLMPLFESPKLSMK